MPTCLPTYGWLYKLGFFEIKTLYFLRKILFTCSSFSGNVDVKYLKFGPNDHKLTFTII